MQPFKIDLFRVFSQDVDKEEMKEILEMKRVHDRLRKKRLVERENRERERRLLREKGGYNDANEYI